MARGRPRGEALHQHPVLSTALEEAPESVDGELVDRIVEGILSRMVCHLEAAEASRGALQSRLDELRKAVDAKTLECAFEGALERVLPGMLQRAVQGCGRTARAPRADREACSSGNSVVLPMHHGPAQVRAAVLGGWGRPSAGSHERSRARSSRGSAGSLLSGEQADPAHGAAQQAEVRMHRPCSGGGALTGQVLPRGSHGCPDEELLPAVRNERQGPPDQFVEHTFSDASIQLLDMSGLQGGAHSDEEGEAHPHVAHLESCSPLQSDAQLTLGRWGPQLTWTPWVSMQTYSASSDCPPVADMDQVTIVAGGTGKDGFQRQQLNSRVRPSFRVPKAAHQTEHMPDWDPIISDDETSASRPGFHNTKSQHRVSGAMHRTRSQSQRDKERLRSRKARIILGMCTLLVLVNAIWVGLRSHYVMRAELIRHGVEVRWDGAGVPQSMQTDGLSNLTESGRVEILRVVDGEGWGHPLLDGVFTILFVVEIGIRMWLYRWDFLIGERWRWNVFDSVLLLLTFIHWFINVLLIDACGLHIARLPRVTFLRILRLPRVAIDLSHLDCIHSLHLMTASILHSLTFSWVAFIVIIGIIYLFSVCFVQGIIDCLENAKVGSITIADLDMIAQKFGSVQITLVSLFQAVSGGIDWIELMGPLSLAPWRYTILLFVYIFVVLFGVLNIVTSMFVECVCQVTKEDYKERIRTELLAQQRWMEQLKMMFLEADADESGGLSWNEFSSLVNVPLMRAYFTTLELNVEEAKEIFEYLDVEGEGEVNMQDFVRGCVCLRGEAKSVDIAVLRSQWQRTSHQLRADMQRFEKQIEQQVRHIHNGLCRTAVPVPGLTGHSDL